MASSVGVVGEVITETVLVHGAAAVTKIHRHGVCRQQKFVFSQWAEVGRLDERVTIGLIPPERRSLACRWPSSPSVFTCVFPLCVSVLESHSSYRATSHITLIAP